MTKRERHRVRSVIRFGRSVQAADALDHLHDLLLFSPTVSDDGLLDLQRRVFVDPDSGFLTCQEDHASSVRHGDAGRDIRVELAENI